MHHMTSSAGCLPGAVAWTRHRSDHISSIFAAALLLCTSIDMQQPVFAVWASCRRRELLLYTTDVCLCEVQASAHHGTITAAEEGTHVPISCSLPLTLMGASAGGVL